MTLLDLLTEAVEAGASQEDMRTRDYAETRINSMSNYELAEALSTDFEELVLSTCGSED